MGSVDLGSHRDHPVHLALGIGLGGQCGKDPVPGAVIGELLVPLPHRLPRPEHLPGKIPPRDPGAVAVGDRLHHGAVITVGTPHLALVARQQRLDSLPLLISENPVTTHPATLPRPSAHGWETRPSRDAPRGCGRRRKSKCGADVASAAATAAITYRWTMADLTELQPVLPPHEVQLGLDTFGDMTVDEEGKPRTFGQVLREVVEQGVLADEVGVDAIGLGEHHRDDYAIAAPEIVLGAIASRTQRILLGTAVTVLSSDDPVRVYEKMATLDGVSDGRAEVTLGRGSFTESFPLYGLDLADYNRLFAEKLDLFALLLRTDGPVSWEGTVRGPLKDAVVYPRPEAG